MITDDETVLTLGNGLKIRLQRQLLVLVGNDDKLSLVLRFAMQLSIVPVLDQLYQLVASLQYCSCAVSARTDFQQKQSL